MLCPNCGHTAQPSLARCGHCNYKLPETALPGAAPDTGKINCWNCLHENAAHAPRCVSCNTKMEKPAALQRRAVVFTPNTSSHDE